jgi:hypothetical protein
MDHRWAIATWSAVKATNTRAAEQMSEPSAKAVFQQAVQLAQAQLDNSLTLARGTPSAPKTPPAVIMPHHGGIVRTKCLEISNGWGGVKMLDRRRSKTGAAASMLTQWSFSPRERKPTGEISW